MNLGFDDTIPWIMDEYRLYTWINITNVQSRGSTHGVTCHDELFEVELGVYIAIAKYLLHDAISAHLINQGPDLSGSNLNLLIPKPLGCLSLLILNLKGLVWYHLVLLKCFCTPIPQCRIHIRSVMVVQQEHHVAIARKLLPHHLVEVSACDETVRKDHWH